MCIRDRSVDYLFRRHSSQYIVRHWCPVSCSVGPGTRVCIRFLRMSFHWSRSRTALFIPIAFTISCKQTVTLSSSVINKVHCANKNRAGAANVVSARLLLRCRRERNNKSALTCRYVIGSQPPGRVAMYWDHRVCMSLCLSVCLFVCLSVRSQMSKFY